MANYTQLLTAFKTSVNQRITSKNTTDSIDPVDVGGSITNFADTILDALNSINDFNILGGTSAPTQGLGNEDDVYIQYGSNLVFWKKDNNAWVSKVNATLGINIPDGNLNLQYRISGMVVTVSSGVWYIDNVQYQKAVQTQFTVPNADLNFDRIDAVFADKLNSIHYVSGAASANPDTTKPTTPDDEIIVTYIYVPKSSSNQLPYIADSNFQDNGFPLLSSGNTEPTGGIDGDVYFEIPVDNTYLKTWQKIAGNWSTVFNLPIGGGTPSTEFRRTFLIPAGTLATDGVLSLEGLTNEQGDQLIPDKPNSNVYDGSSGAVYRLDKTINGLETDEDGLTVRDVLVVLNGVEPVVQIGITNTTDRVINYSLNGGGFSSLNIGEFLAVNPSDTIIMQLASASGNFYLLLNQNGDLQNTDGLYRIDETPHQWNIPSDTTNLQIISSL